MRPRHDSWRAWQRARWARGEQDMREILPLPPLPLMRALLSKFMRARGIHTQSSMKICRRGRVAPRAPRRPATLA
eukprot:9060096-Pyramimonas_sp.AAC.1